MPLRNRWTALIGALVVGLMYCETPGEAQAAPRKAVARQELRIMQVDVFNWDSMEVSSNSGLFVRGFMLTGYVAEHSMGQADATPDKSARSTVLIDLDQPIGQECAAVLRMLPSGKTRPVPAPGYRVVEITAKGTSDVKGYKLMELTSCWMFQR